MTAHDHRDFVEGCHRCELSRAEAAQQLSDGEGRPLMPVREFVVRFSDDPGVIYDAAYAQGVQDTVNSWTRAYESLAKEHRALSARYVDLLLKDMPSGLTQ